MNEKTIQLIDAGGRLLGVARVVDEGAYYGGMIDLSATPAEVRALFDLFEELVNSQEFTCADEVETKIDALSIRAVFEDGTAASAADLQVFPGTGDISFTVARATGVNGAREPARKSLPS